MNNNCLACEIMFLFESRFYKTLWSNVWGYAVGFSKNFFGWIGGERARKSLCSWGSGLITKKPTKNLMTQFLNKIFSKKLKTKI